MNPGGTETWAILDGGPLHGERQTFKAGWERPSHVDLPVQRPDTMRTQKARYQRDGIDHAVDLHRFKFTGWVGQPY